MQEEVEGLDQNVPVFPENTHVWKERHINNNMKHNIKTKANSNSPPKLDTSKSFNILPLSKTILSPPKQRIFKNLFKQDSHISSISPPFCHVLTKTTQTKSKQKTYGTKVKRK